MGRQGARRNLRLHLRPGKSAQNVVKDQREISRKFRTAPAERLLITRSSTREHAVVSCTRARITAFLDVLDEFSLPLVKRQMDFAAILGSLRRNQGRLTPIAHSHTKLFH